MHTLLTLILIALVLLVAFAWSLEHILVIRLQQLNTCQRETYELLTRIHCDLSAVASSTDTLASRPLA